MSAATLELLINAKDNASGVLGKVEKASSRLSSKLGTGLKVAGVAAAAGIGAAAYAIAGFVKDAAAEQVGIAQLTTAIGTLDAAHRGNSATVETLVRSREKLSFADDQLRASLAILIPATGDYDEAVRRQAVAMDLARGAGLDLETASRLVGKVTEENTNVLKRYGVTVRDGATEQEALAAIQAKFAGQSEAYANTAAGKWELFGNQMDNIKESIGGALLPTVTELGTKLGEFLTSHQAEIDEFSAWLGVKIPEAIDAISGAIENAMPTLESLFNTMRSGFEVIRPGLEWIINNKYAVALAFTVMGAAAILAFTPVTLPILAVIGALTALLLVLGFSRNHWDDVTGAVDRHRVAITLLAIPLATIALPIAVVAGLVLALKAAWDVFGETIVRVVDSSIGKISDLIDKINDIPSPGDIFGAVTNAWDRATHPFGRNADGTESWRGGLTWVGERGPELVNIPPRSRIYSNADSERMVTAAGASPGVTNVFHVYVQEWHQTGTPEAGFAALGAVL